MKSMQSYIFESSNEFLVQYFNGQHEARSFATLNAARKFIKTVKNLKYYDITKGSDSADEANLIEWGGEGGFWDNLCNNPVFAQNRREKAIAQRAAKKRVEL